MKEAKIKTYRGVAFSYGLLGVAFLGITGFTISLLGWHGIDQFIKDIKMFIPTLLPITIFALFNICMAAASWNYLNHSKNKKKAILCASLLLVALPAFSLISSVAGGTYKENQVISVLLVVNYSLLAFYLAKGMNSNKLINRTENTSVQN